MKVVDGVTVLVYKEGSAHDVNDGELHIRFSDDYGQTWSAEDEYLDTTAITGFPMNPSTLSGGEDAGEPWLYLADNGDLILHMWRVDYGVSRGGTWQSVSSNGGLSWSTSSQVDFSGISGDDYILATDDDFVLSGTIYAAARIHADATPSNSYCVLIKSEDDGASWSYVSDITASGSLTHEVGLEYLGNNTIIAIIRSLNNSKTYRRYSTDLGATWETLEDISTAIQVSGRHRIYTLSHLKEESNWWNDQTLIMVGFVNGTIGLSTPRRNCIWISLDGGNLWTSPMYIDSQYEDGGYGDVIYDPNNNEFVVVSYVGSLGEANLKQYNISVGGL